MSGLSFAGGNIAPIVPIDEPVEESVLPDNSAFYLGLGYSYLNSNRTATLNKPGDPQDGQTVKNTDSIANNLLIQAGYRFNPYLAIEGRYTFSVGNHSLTYHLLDDLEKDVDIDIYNAAIYLKPSYPIGPLSVYALLGYGKIEREYNPEPSHTWEGDGFQWGVGLQYSVMGHLSIFADYTLWYDEEDEEPLDDDSDEDDW